MGRFIPGDFYQVTEDEFINLINSFNRFEMPLQNHADYLEDVLGLLHQHPTLESLCETLKIRQLEMAAKFLEKTTSIIKLSLAGSPSLLFPGENDSERRERVIMKLSRFLHCPSAEFLGNYFGSYVDPPRSPETEEMVSVKPAAPATPSCSTTSASSKLTPPSSPPFQVPSSPSTSSGNGILPKTRQDSSQKERVQRDSDALKKGDTKGGVEPKQSDAASARHPVVDSLHGHDSCPRIKRKRRSSTSSATGITSSAADVRESKAPKRRSRSSSRGRSKHPASAEGGGGEGLCQGSCPDYTTDGEDGRAQKRTRLDNHHPPTKPRARERGGVAEPERTPTGILSSRKARCVEVASDEEEVDRTIYGDHMWDGHYLPNNPKRPDMFQGKKWDARRERSWKAQYKSILAGDILPWWATMELQGQGRDANDAGGV